MKIKRGDLCTAKFSPVIGSEQGGTRSCVIIQNDKGNEFSNTTIVALITSKKFSKNYPFNVQIPKNESDLTRNSVIMLNQIRTIDKSRLTKNIGKLNPSKMKQVDKAIKISLDID